MLRSIGKQSGESLIQHNQSTTRPFLRLISSVPHKQLLKYGL